jgi:TonB family protein
MYLDLEDYRPDTPRVPAAISLREGVLISLLLHALAVIAYLVMPEFRSHVNAVLMPPPQPSTPFVQMVPRREMPAVPRAGAESSDLDRRATSPVTPPDPRNTAPYSRGDTPDKVVGAPVEKPAGPDSPSTGPPSTAAPTDPSGRIVADAASVARPAGGGLGASLRNLQKFLADQNYDNPQGGQTDPNTDIQFDSKGVEFGPWLRRFVAQVKRNWLVPKAADFMRGRVVIQFYVLRNGTITDLKVVQPSPIESFNLAALNALKASNPTMTLPPEYPDDRAFFTVTFHYNDRDYR